MEPSDLKPEEQAAIDDFKKIRGEKKGGRPSKQFAPALKIAATILKETRKLTNAQIAEELNVHPNTVAKLLRDDEVKVDAKDMEKAREQFAGHIASIVGKMLGRANSDIYIDRLASAKNTGLIQAVTAMIGAMQNLSGKPSNILEVRDQAADVQKKLAEIAEIEKLINESILPTKNPKAN